jgi:hypothetical protein
MDMSSPRGAASATEPSAGSMAAENAAGDGLLLGGGLGPGGVGGLHVFDDRDLLSLALGADADGSRAARADDAGLDGELDGGADDAGGGEGEHCC